MSKLQKMLEEIRPEFDFTQSTNFIEDGYLDSFDSISLVSMLDKEYNISIKGTDITPENFASLASIRDLMGRYGVSDEA